MPEVSLVERLPLEVTTPSDLMRVSRELRAAIDELEQLSLVEGQSQITRTILSDGLIKIAQVNSVDINDSTQRIRFLNALDYLKESAPIVHLSFASEPSLEAVRTIVDWFRREVSPLVVVQVGVQPSIVVGCAVRTANRVFDLTLTRSLDEAKGALRKGIGLL